MSALIALVITVAVLYFVCEPLFVAEADETEKETESRRMRCLQQLASLERDRSEGIIGEEDFAAAKEKVSAELSAIEGRSV